jgi:branched-chain amino acid transport system substrate-binding protein
MRASAGLAIFVVAAVWLGAGCGSTKPEAFRIGILTDCFGPFSTLYETSVAAAELPLLERGGRLAGKQPSSGVAGARVAGRPAELEIGCVSGNDDVIPVARRLVEERGARAIVGPLDPQEGMILREYARRQPATAFLIQPSGAPELTLTRPAPNVFRFAPDAAQSVAGAGSYAYRDLGWRTAAIVADDIPYSWEGAAGFISEFCSLGGRIVDRAWIPVGADPAAVVPHLPPATDGVYLGLALSSAVGFLTRYAAHHAVSRRLVSTTPLLYDPRVIPLTRGVVVAGSLPVQTTAAMAGYAASFAKAFPALSAAAAIEPNTVSYRDGVEALLEALDQSGGKTGAPLLARLARLALDSPMGRIRLDANRQAVGPNYLSRIAVDLKGKPAIRTVRVVPNVEQRFGGYFAPGGPPPNRTHPACVKRTPPPWAR